MSLIHKCRLLQIQGTIQTSQFALCATTDVPLRFQFHIVWISSALNAKQNTQKLVISYLITLASNDTHKPTQIFSRTEPVGAGQ